MVPRTDPPDAQAPLCGDRRRTQDVLKLDQETDADMVIGDDISEGDDDGSRIAFEWKTEVRKYRRSPTKIKLNQTSRVSGRS